MSEAKTKDHQACVIGVVTAASLLAHLDLPGALNAISCADAVGHILDPTLYREKSKAMHEDREVLEAALPLWRLAQKLQEPTR